WGDTQAVVVETDRVADIGGPGIASEAPVAHPRAVASIQCGALDEVVDVLVNLARAQRPGLADIAIVELQAQLGLAAEDLEAPRSILQQLRGQIGPPEFV